MDEVQQIKISVIIPCYNEEQYIGQAIGSIIEQTWPADEIIVVDDGSDDRSTKIAKSFGEIVTVLSTGGAGAPKARNLGADHASGDALMFFDADDVLGPRALESLAACLKQNPDGIAACSWFRLQKVDDKWVQRPKSCLPLGDDQDHLSGWLTGWWQPPCSVLWSRTAYEKTGEWDPNVTVNQDGDIMMRALVEEIELQLTDKGSAYYRRTPADEQSVSISAGRFKQSGRASQIFVLKKIITKLEERGQIDNYRKPLTKALNKIRTMCQDHYPELAVECSTLISKYGDPGYVQTSRKSSSFLRYVLRAVFNWTASSLSYLGLHRTRQFVSNGKNRFLGKKPNGGKIFKKNQILKDETEISYGMDSCQKAAEKRKSV